MLVRIGLGIAVLLIMVSVFVAGAVFGQEPIGNLISEDVIRVPNVGRPSRVDGATIKIIGGRIIQVQLPGKNARFWKIKGDSMYPISTDDGSWISVQIAIDEIVVGDILIHRALGLDALVVGHQVTEIGTDDKGWYAVTMGTNPLSEQDFWRVRAKDVLGVVVAIF